MAIVLLMVFVFLGVGVAWLVLVSLLDWAAKDNRPNVRRLKE